jgi:hypothetical protein
MNSAEKRRRSSTAAICRSSSSRPSVKIDVSSRVTRDSIGTLLYVSCHPKKKHKNQMRHAAHVRWRRHGSTAPIRRHGGPGRRARVGADHVGPLPFSPWRPKAMRASATQLPTWKRLTRGGDAHGADRRCRGAPRFVSRLYVPRPVCVDRCRRSKTRLKADETGPGRQPCWRLAAQRPRIRKTGARMLMLVCSSFALRAKMVFRPATKSFMYIHN